MTDEDLNKIGDLIDSKLEPVKAELNVIKGELNNPETGLKALNKQINDPEFGLKALNTKVEDNIAELSEVHKLAGATYDLVKLEPQKRRQEINEIREHVGLSPLSSE